MNILILILNGFEALALVTGMLYFKRLQHAYLKYFVYLLGFIFLSELAGKFLKLIDARNLNTIWYGFFVLPIQFLVFYWLYSKRTSIKNIFIIPSLIYLCSLLVDLFLLQHKTYFFSNLTYTIGNILLLIIIVYYFYKLLRSNDILYFKQDSFFWIGLGQLIFYLSTLPFYFFSNYIYQMNIDYYYNYYYFVVALNCIMYVCYTISFLWKKAN